MCRLECAYKCNMIVISRYVKVRVGSKSVTFDGPGYPLHVSGGVVLGFSQAAGDGKLDIHIFSG